MQNENDGKCHCPGKNVDLFLATAFVSLTVLNGLGTAYGAVLCVLSFLDDQPISTKALSGAVTAFGAASTVATATIASCAMRSNNPVNRFFTTFFTHGKDHDKAPLAKALATAARLV
ncbi:MAG: hypothetical protein A2X77_02235 [Gammaproteobacteria bacterium GWE2_42_36]|nr:MAG: hypothetical protein A2X77_02235 [Gammaproteobacteria bacterium GWE2_42_36]HCU04850.1 hypothetical protein [Coxiellaceae bacterium]